ncbi:unnamed protein product [Camellia sinensis]
MDRNSETCRVETRSLLKGIDVNRVPSTIDCEEEAGVSSPNSTISSISGKRSEREEPNGEDLDLDLDLERASSRGISDEEDGDTSRKKLRLSKDQSMILEESFKVHNTLNPKQKLALAKRLGLRPRQVEVWFQNRRASESPGTPIRSLCDSQPLEGGPSHKLPKSETTENKATVLYIGRIPHGFYENEMEGFFKQFGTIKKLDLPRIRRDSHVGVCLLLLQFRHFFFTAMLFVYGRILNQRLANTITSEKFFYHLVSGFIKYYMVTCYFLYGVPGAS